MVNIIPFSTNQFADTFYVRDKDPYWMDVRAFSSDIQKLPTENVYFHKILFGNFLMNSLN